MRHLIYLSPGLTSHANYGAHGIYLGLCHGAIAKDTLIRGNQFYVLYPPGGNPLVPTKPTGYIAVGIYVPGAPGCDQNNADHRQLLYELSVGGVHRREREQRSRDSDQIGGRPFAAGYSNYVDSSGPNLKFNFYCVREGPCIAEQSARAAPQLSQTSRQGQPGGCLFSLRPLKLDVVLAPEPGHQSPDTLEHRELQGAPLL
jgi:hypothetical protein